VILYLDASALAKRYVREVGSDIVTRHLELTPCVTSRWSEVEIVSALARRCREGALPPAERDRAVDALHSDLLALHVVEVSRAVTRLAAELLRRHPLRAGDAVHLASAVHLGDLLRSPIAFLAFDDRLSRAAAGEGLEPPDDPLQG
jgi:predicted nucleic acid-binding protein